MPAGSTVIFSAHGVSKAVRDQAEARGLKVFDATCPLVTKVHVEVGRMPNQALEMVMIGHKGHPVVEGTMGQSRDGMWPCRNTRRCQKSQGPCSRCVSLRHQEHDDASVVIAALKEQFPDIQGPKKDDICYATQNRQDAVKALAEQCDLVIVVGSPNSSNSRRLKEVAIARGIAGHLIDGPDEIDPAWLAGRQKIGITVDASAPEIPVRREVDRIGQLTGAFSSPAIGAGEGVSLPQELVELPGLPEMKPE